MLLAPLEEGTIYLHNPYYLGVTKILESKCEQIHKCGITLLAADNEVAPIWGCSCVCRQQEDFTREELIKEKVSHTCSSLGLRPKNCSLNRLDGNDFVLKVFSPHSPDPISSSVSSSMSPPLIVPGLLCFEGNLPCPELLFVLKSWNQSRVLQHLSGHSGETFASVENTCRNKETVWGNRVVMNQLVAEDLFHHRLLQRIKSHGVGASWG